MFLGLKNLHRGFSATRRARKTLFNQSAANNIKVVSKSMRPDDMSDSASEYQNLIPTATEISLKVNALVQSIMDSPNSDRNLRAIVDVMAVCYRNHFRTPLRDLAPQTFRFLNDYNRETVDLALLALQYTGRGMIFYQELFDYLVKADLDGPQLAVFIYECGRHGLRCKHYLDKITRVTPPQMNQEDVMRCLKGITKFAPDYAGFARKISARLNYSSLSSSEYLILLRVFKAIDDSRQFTICASKVEISGLSLINKFGLLYLLKKSRSFKMGTRDSATIEKIALSLVNTLQDVGLDQMRSDLITTDISDALDAMASMKIRNQDLLSKLVPVLVDRIVEIKYSPICGLWQSITDSLGHLNYFDWKWMRIADTMASSEFNLKSFASFQLIFFASSMGRLNFFSERAFTALTNVIATDIASIQDVDMLATLLFPLQRANFKSDGLVKTVMDHTISLINKCKEPSRNTLRGVLGVTYSSVALGYSDREKIGKLLRCILFQPIDKKVFTKQDLARFYRLSVLGHVQLEDLPVSVREDDHFNAWGVSLSSHQKRVDQIFNTSAKKNMDVGFVDFVLEDGTAVVVEDDHDPIMSTWKYPNDHANGELVALPTTGGREMIRRYLNGKGFDMIRFVAIS